MEDFAEKNQKINGVIIALEEDIKIRRALAVANTIDYFRYQVSFTLNKSPALTDGKVDHRKL